nr:AAA family ATPase [Thermomonas sp.]
LVGDSDALATRVREFASARYRDGYEKGIHDHDATLILRAVVPLYRPAGPLVHAADARALAVAFWRHAQATPEAGWLERIRNAKAVRSHLQDATATSALATELAEAIAQFRVQQTLPLAEGLQAEAAAFLIAAITADSDQLPFTRYAASLLDALHAQLAASGSKALFNQALERLQDRPGAQWSLLLQWLQALAARPEHAALAAYAHEAAALHLHGPQLPHRIVDVRLMAEATSLLGQHPRIVDGTLRLAIDDLQSRLREHQATFLPAFRRYQEVRARIVQREREAMRLSEFKARPLTSFVRNRLINDVYLRVIGDNLAKQMGTVGEDKRSDLMGLLMLISPPGYGKTTLMEYVAHRLGLVFMKINGPSLGHQVRSLDPAQAPDATSRQELEKLNLALEMGNNVMLYVDDIQHTHPEFLQKFISLCDGTRRIEGVWRGQTRTYDLRGRKFAVVMAGNPYTESGEAFKIPDMLANRADIYNLGDVLGGMEDTFLLSYIENSLTSNAVLAPLATRDLADLYLLVDKARGREVSTNALTHAYSGAEINEIVGVLQRMLQVREVVFKVNMQYIASAAQADKYRVEPPFKLQGSYRNMNKLAEKISPVMNDAELRQVIADHYLGESQLLTQGAEENLLKLGELLGRMTPEQQSRWAQIKADFLRNKAMGADDADVGGRMVAQLADIAGGLQGLRDEPPPPAPQPPPWSDLLDALARIATPPASPTAASAPEQPVGDLLRSAHQPLLEGLERTLARQDHLHSALLELVEALKAGGITHASQREPAERVIPRIRTPEERAFEKTISALKFKAAEDAKKADAAKPPGEPGAS